MPTSFNIKDQLSSTPEGGCRLLAVGCLNVRFCNPVWIYLFIHGVHRAEKVEGGQCSGRQNRKKIRLARSPIWLGASARRAAQPRRRPPVLNIATVTSDPCAELVTEITPGDGLRSVTDKVSLANCAWQARSWFRLVIVLRSCMSLLIHISWPTQSTIISELKQTEKEKIESGTTQTIS